MIRRPRRSGSPGTVRHRDRPVPSTSGRRP